MLKKILSVVITLIGIALGLTLFFFLKNATDIFPSGVVATTVLAISTIIVFGIIFSLLAPIFINLSLSITTKIEKEFSQFKTVDILTSSLGGIIGLIIAYFIGTIVQKIPVVGVPISAFFYIFMLYLGIKISLKRKEDILSLFVPSNWSTTKNKDQSMIAETVRPKILDTSVIIDGRIADIAKTGFIEGKLIVPSFVLEELRHIADSSDDLKRTKGRRGLDILNSMQAELKLQFEITEKDFDTVKEVDMKLLKLAEELGGIVLTNDFNLNKVAKFQGVKVLNINELSNAVKPIFLPGEVLDVTVIKEGKEMNQGVAYLEDGTMIVVEGAKKMVGMQKTVIVTSVLQTAAGRMIFAKPMEK
ncbi:PIN domain protein [Filifactor alocis ATCC 35896]|jgi:Integral membrane protein (PIN domain superfamily)|uniref:PIN domain protein n=1 Tax=Filifactor alocis (strain ATCC 35896 / CCUG 47790 / D40 B5) TaxID=546269 RepID=D6GR62_FILAD|nr:PIN domain-containing protein [Filifactor alocis]EFE28153.1 PIN domain protein [Filifactor alocis ATCC 35896]